MRRTQRKRRLERRRWRRAVKAMARMERKAHASAEAMGRFCDALVEFLGIDTRSMTKATYYGRSARK